MPVNRGQYSNKKPLLQLAFPYNIQHNEENLNFSKKVWL